MAARAVVGRARLLPRLRRQGRRRVVRGRVGLVGGRVAGWVLVVAGLLALLVALSVVVAVVVDSAPGSLALLAGFLADLAGLVCLAWLLLALLGRVPRRVRGRRRGINGDLRGR